MLGRMDVDSGSFLAEATGSDDEHVAGLPTDRGAQRVSPNEGAHRLARGAEG